MSHEPKFIAKVRLNSQGQLTLPSEARESLHIKKESDMFWYVVDDMLILTSELLAEKDIEKKMRRR